MKIDRLLVINEFVDFLHDEFTKEKLEKIDDLRHLEEVRRELYKLNNKINFLNIWNRIQEIKTIEKLNPYL